MIEIELSWSAVCHISELDKAPVNSGFYFWMLKTEQAYIPYYVGKSDNIQYRLGQHLSYLIGGRYDIYPKDQIYSFTKFKKDKRELIYNPDSITKVVQFYKDYNNIFPHLSLMVDKFYFTYSIYENNYPDIPKTKALLDIEKSIIKCIGIDNLSNSTGGIAKIFKVRHKASQEILQHFSTF